MSNSFWSWRRPDGIRRRPGTPVILGTADAICSIFGDENVSDVVLQGYDGGSVVAVKAILASRSTMFRHQFFNDSRSSFIPKSLDEKEVVVYDEWDCRILHLVVEYCYTDTCSAMKSQPTDDIARMLATLRVASKTFKLPGLQDKIRQWVWRQMSRHPALICAMVDEGLQNDDVDELALQTLQLKSRAALLPDKGSVGSGVLALSRPGLLFVLRTLEENTSPHLLLLVVERWIDFLADGCSGEDARRERASREAFARKCATRFINISNIPQQHLDSVMKRSNLLASNNFTHFSMDHSNLNSSILSTSFASSRPIHSPRSMPKSSSSTSLQRSSPKSSMSPSSTYT